MSIRKRPPTHPGRLLKVYYLEPREISVADFAKAAGLSRKHVSQIVHGHAGISADAAMRFASVLGTSPEFWLNLQAAMDLYEAALRLEAGKGAPVEAGRFARRVGRARELVAA